MEVGKWWLPGQKTPEEDAIRDWEQQPSFSNPIVRTDGGKWSKHVGMHYATVQDDIAYLSYHQAGLVIMDVSDKSNPELLSRTDYLLPGADATNPDIAACKAAAGREEAACGNTHAAKRIPNTDLLMVSDEYFTCPYGHVRIFDVADGRNPQLLSHYLHRSEYGLRSRESAASRRHVALSPPRTVITYRQSAERRYLPHGLVRQWGASD